MVFAAPGLLHAEISLGNKGALALGLDAGVEYDSNVELNRAEEDDVIGYLLPKLLYRYDQGAVLIDAHVGVLIREYDDLSDYDSDSFKSRVQVSFPHGEYDANYELDLDTGYNESTEADGDLQEVLDKETLHFNLTGKYNFTDRYYVRSGVLYKDVDTVQSSRDDVETVTVPVDFFYRYNEDLSFGLGYRFRDTDVDPAGSTSADSKDHAVYAAAEGRVTATIDGEVRVGYQERDFSDSSFEDEDGLFAEVVLSWAYSEQSTLAFTAGRELMTSVGTQSIEQTYVDLEWEHRINEKISIWAGAGYEERDYTSLVGDAPREDDIYYAELGGEYVLIEDRLVLEGSLQQTERSSDDADSDYSKTLAIIGISLVY